MDAGVRALQLSSLRISIVSRARASDRVASPQIGVTMRHRTRAFFLAATMLLLAACNGSGLPVSPTNTPQIGSEAATPTAESVASRPSATPRGKQDRPIRTPVAEETSEPTAEADPTETTEPEPTTQAGNGDLDEELRQVEEDTSRTRGLEIKEEVQTTFYNQAQMKDALLRSITEDYPLDEARADAMELWLMRLMDDPNTDLFQLQVDLLGEQVLGYYDPEKDELFVLRESKDLGPSSKQTLAHELIHALQDQHFDLDKLLPHDSYDDDRSLAIRALVEGDATLGGLSYVRDNFSQDEIQEFLNESSSGDSSVLNSAPAYLRESLYFPYSAGADFVNELLMMNGFAAVDEALADPPSSTEQIMHPDKYFDSPRDEPVQVALEPLTDTLGAGWTLNDWGTIGEFDLNIILDENGASDPDEGAAGWGGGSYAYYQNGDMGLMYIGTEWDSNGESGEFYDQMLETFDNANQDGDLYEQDGRFFSLTQDGRAVTLISSNDRAALENVVR